MGISEIILPVLNNSACYEMVKAKGKIIPVFN